MYVYFCRDSVCDSDRWCDRGFHHDGCVYVRGRAICSLEDSIHE